MTKLGRAIIMLYYKCSVAAIPDYTPPSASISNIPFDDVDKLVSVVTVSNHFIDKEESYDSIDAAIAYQLLSSIIGETASLYCMPAGYMGNTYGVNCYDLLMSAFPSIEKMFPNTYQKVHNTPREARQIHLYLPSLKRYCTGGVDGDFWYIYEVNDAGLIVSPELWKGQIGGPIFGYAQGNINSLAHVVLPCLVYNNDDSILNRENYTFVQLMVQKTSLTNYKATVETVSNFYTTPNAQSGLDALFGYSHTPDKQDPNNPYEPGGPSGPTDPDLPPGTFDDESDPIPDSPLPTLSAANTGFTRIYNPTLSQVQALARYLWTDPDVIQTIWNHIKQFFEDPMEAIIGFNLVPVPVPDGGTENFALMYIDTGVQMTVAANQFVDLDCGTLELKRYYGSALDQSPYTKVSCYLPYIGTVNLNTDEVMGTTLQVKYRVDIVSGSCVAKIFVDGNCLYQYSGHCAITIPISSADFSSYVSAAISVGKLAAAAITAGAGAAAAAGVGEVAQQTNQIVTTTQTTSTARNPATGRQITTGTTTTVQTRESPADQSSTQASFSGLSPQNVANTVGAIMSSKPHIEHSGSFSGNSGYLGVRRPFVIIERPNMCMPANYQALNGFPAMITMELSTCKGFTRVQQVQLTGLHATNPEQAEILELLKSGVIL